MRIINLDNMHQLDNIMLFITVNECKDMIGDLEGLLDEPVNNNHIHFDDEEFKREITISVYDDTKDLSSFAQKFIDIIKSKDI